MEEKLEKEPRKAVRGAKGNPLRSQDTKRLAGGIAAGAAILLLGLAACGWDPAKTAAAFVAAVAVIAVVLLIGRVFGRKDEK